jgi:hypothetical protein
MRGLTPNNRSETAVGSSEQSENSRPSSRALKPKA